jgi:hypothetical protein
VTAPVQPPVWPRIATMNGGIDYHLRPIRTDDTARRLN